MTPVEARTLKRGDHVEFSDPALTYAFLAPVPGVVMWVICGEEGEPPEHEIGIAWGGVKAVSQDPETDFEHVRKVEHA
jgi:hypothetical protein